MGRTQLMPGTYHNISIQRFTCFFRVRPESDMQGEMSYYSSSRSSSRATDCKVSVGDLGSGVATGELERAFSYYGPLQTVWLARNLPAWVEYEDPKDAEDAVKGMDGKVMCGSRIRVEMSMAMSRKGRSRPSRRHFDTNDRCYQCGVRGHYAYDCYCVKKRGGGRRSRSGSPARSKSRSPVRSRSRSRSRSGSRPRRHSVSGSRSRSTSHKRNR